MGKGGEDAAHAAVSIRQVGIRQGARIRGRSEKLGDLPAFEHQLADHGAGLELLVGLAQVRGIDRRKRLLQRAAQLSGVEPRSTSTDEGARFVRTESDKWTKVVTDGKLKTAR